MQDSAAQCSDADAEFADELAASGAESAACGGPASAAAPAAPSAGTAPGAPERPSPSQEAATTSARRALSPTLGGRSWGTTLEVLEGGFAHRQRELRDLRSSGQSEAPARRSGSSLERAAAYLAELLGEFQDLNNQDEALRQAGRPEAIQRYRERALARAAASLAGLLTEFQELGSQDEAPGSGGFESPGVRLGRLGRPSPCSSRSGRGGAVPEATPATAPPAATDELEPSLSSSSDAAAEAESPARSESSAPRLAEMDAALYAMGSAVHRAAVVLLGAEEAPPPPQAPAAAAADGAGSELSDAKEVEAADAAQHGGAPGAERGDVAAAAASIAAAAVAAGAIGLPTAASTAGATGASSGSGRDEGGLAAPGSGGSGAGGAAAVDHERVLQELVEHQVSLRSELVEARKACDAMAAEREQLLSWRDADIPGAPSRDRGPYGEEVGSPPRRRATLSQEDPDIVSAQPRPLHVRLEALCLEEGGSNRQLAAPAYGLQPTMQPKSPGDRRRPRRGRGGSSSDACCSAALPQIERSTASSNQRRRPAPEQQEEQEVMSMTFSPRWRIAPVVRKEVVAEAPAAASTTSGASPLEPKGEEAPEEEPTGSATVSAVDMEAYTQEDEPVSGGDRQVELAQEVQLLLDEELRLTREVARTAATYYVGDLVRGFYQRQAGASLEECQEQQREASRWRAAHWNAESQLVDLLGGWPPSRSGHRRATSLAGVVVPPTSQSLSPSASRKWRRSTITGATPRFAPGSSLSPSVQLAAELRRHARTGSWGSATNSSPGTRSRAAVGGGAGGGARRSQSLQARRLFVRSAAAVAADEESGNEGARSAPPQDLRCRASRGLHRSFESDGGQWHAVAAESMEDDSGAMGGDDTDSSARSSTTKGIPPMQLEDGMAAFADGGDETVVHRVLRSRQSGSVATRSSSSTSPSRRLLRRVPAGHVQRGSWSQSPSPLGTMELQSPLPSSPTPELREKPTLVEGFFHVVVNAPESDVAPPEARLCWPVALRASPLEYAVVTQGFCPDPRVFDRPESEGGFSGEPFVFSLLETTLDPKGDPSGVLYGCVCGDGDGPVDPSLVQPQAPGQLESMESGDVPPTNSFGSAAHRARNTGHNEGVLCIVSKFPLFGFLFGLLGLLRADLSANAATALLERLRAAGVDEHLAIQGIDLSDLPAWSSLGRLRLEVPRPLDCEWHNLGQSVHKASSQTFARWQVAWGLTGLFSRWEALVGDTLAKLLACVLLEQKVLLLGDAPRVSTMALVLRGLLWPFRWLHTCVTAPPPADLTRYPLLESPAPIIVSVSELPKQWNYRTHYELPHEVITAVLKHNYIYTSKNLETSGGLRGNSIKLPAGRHTAFVKQVAQAKRQLHKKEIDVEHAVRVVQEAAQSEVWQLAELMRRFAAAFVEDVRASSSAVEEGEEHQQELAPGVLRERCLDEVIDLEKFYQKFVRWLKEGGAAAAGLDVGSAETIAFFDTFFHTQACLKFLEEEVLACTSDGAVSDWNYVELP